MNFLNNINMVENAINNTKTHLNDNILNIYGLSSPKSQCFLNNVCKNKNVLEIGSFCGASTVPIAESANIVYTVDNWKNIENVPINNNFMKKIINPRFEFLKNTEKYNNIRLLDGDIFSKELFVSIMNINTLNRFDVIFYDGSHTEKDIITFILLYEFLLIDCVLIIDDYNFQSVKNSLKIGINKLKNKPIKEFLIDTGCENKNTFWNGLGIFIFK